MDVEEYYQTAISKFSKEKIDAYHQLTRDSIKDIDLEYVQEGFEGLEYRRFIKLHFYMHSCDELLRSIASNYAAFNPQEREAAKTILKMYDQYAIDPNFWNTDTGQVLKEMSESFKEILKSTSTKPGTNQKKPMSGEQNSLSVMMTSNGTDLIDCLITSRLPSRRCQFGNFTGWMVKPVGMGRQ
ncbi:hypothetical protein ACFL5Z_20045 [Planctomycetota bacterium]